MQITKEQLKKIILEELEEAQREHYIHYFLEAVENRCMELLGITDMDSEEYAEAEEPIMGLLRDEMPEIKKHFGKTNLKATNIKLVDDVARGIVERFRSGDTPKKGIFQYGRQTY
jgi:hypothetical protein